MTYRLISVGMAAALLSGACATSPEPYLSDDVHVVDMNQLAQYWVMRPESVRIRTRLPRSARPYPRGYVVLQYLIDSNGEVFAAKALESAPGELYLEPALQQLAAREFEAAADNPGRVPVQVTQKIDFRQGECPADA